jgi:hypothetical protein
MNYDKFAKGRECELLWLSAAARSNLPDLSSFFPE